MEYPSHRATLFANTIPLPPTPGTQYAQFGSEFRHLHDNLKILTSVVLRAEESLVSHDVRSSGHIRWDPASLMDIIGDFQSTLDECLQLLRDNWRYSVAATDNPVRGIQWNVILQPTVDRLRVRIQMHTSRIMNVLKPFEMYVDVWI